MGKTKAGFNRQENRYNMDIRKVLLLCGLALSCVGMKVSAQAPYDDNETAKLRRFLMQQSAEPGVRNYQQLGIVHMDSIKWENFPGLHFNNQTYLLERVSWAGRNLSGDMDFSGFQALRIMYCAANDIKSVNVYDSPSLMTFDFYENDLYHVDFSTNTRLDWVRVGYNNLTSLDFSNNPELKFLCCTHNYVESLDMSGKEKLQELLCVGNGLTSLKVDNCVVLSDLLCGHNRLESLSLYNMPRLKKVSCIYNELEDLSFYNCTSLETVLCDSNRLQTLDFAQFEKLTFVNCSNNEITSLNIEGCSSLVYLDCESNKIASLDISESPLLSTLLCGYNSMNFLTLPRPSETLTSYRYAPQDTVFLDCKYDSIDLTHLYAIDDSLTRYTWRYNYTTISPLQNLRGLFSFDESYIGETFICTMRNNTYPNVVLRYDITLTRDGNVDNVVTEQNVSSVHASDGYIHIVTPSMALVSVYSMQGNLVMDRTVGEGRSDIPIKRGMYVVALNNQESYKVFVR